MQNRNEFWGEFRYCRHSNETEVFRKFLGENYHILPQNWNDNSSRRNSTVWSELENDALWKVSVFLFYLIVSFSRVVRLSSKLNWTSGTLMSHAIKAGQGCGEVGFCVSNSNRLVSLLRWMAMRCDVTNLNDRSALSCIASIRSTDQLLPTVCNWKPVTRCHLQATSIRNSAMIPKESSKNCVDFSGNTYSE